MLQRFKNIYHFWMAFLAATFYGYPAKKLKVIGVTGTDGKTTTTHIIYHILKSSGKKVSMISSVKAVIGNKEYDTGFHVTTPDPWDVQKYLKEALKDESEYIVLEVTSHALDQNRVSFCNFLIGVLTNVTNEHLDYHKNYENYIAIKLKLLERVKTAVVNRDDNSYEYVLKNSKIKKRGVKIVTYGIKNKADFTPKTFPFKNSLLGEFNHYNILAAIACSSSLRLKPEDIAKAIPGFQSVIGRLEMVTEKPIKIIVDFAHTPNALEKILETVRTLNNSGKIISVFGCAGLRDFKKRPVMGEISSKLADYTVITAEDPRTEDLVKIMNQIAQGCQKTGAIEERKYFKIADRQEAINFAIQKLAKPGDLVVITGKGHEKSMCFGKKEYPWSDQEAVKQALAIKS